MNVTEKDILVKRDNKIVYRVDDETVKVFAETHPKANIFNEALNQARVETTGLPIPAVKRVTNVNGKWAVAVEYIEGKTLEEIMRKDPENMQKYMEQFVDIQMEIHSKRVPLLNRLKDKLVRQINATELDATTRYELMTRLDGMPKHLKLCHGDFVPSNVVIRPDGTYAILDWPHATQGNASADAANTYLMFALEDEKTAKLYLDIFSKKTDTAKQYIQQWMPIVAAAWLAKCKPEQKEFLMQWTDVIEFQ